MSAAIKLYKARYRGDPGLFGDVGKFIGGAVKGAVGGLLTGNPMAGLTGGITGGVQAISKPMKAGTMPSVNIVAGNGKPLNPSLAKAMPFALAGGAGFVAGPGGGPGIPGLPQIDSTRTSGISLFPGGPMVGTQTTYTSSPGSPAAAGVGCPAGYHLNKSGYWTRSGYVPARSSCVRNRRRNPLNPRAASRAMSRLTSARKATRSITRFFGSTKGGRAAPKKGPCGCKGRR